MAIWLVCVFQKISNIVAVLRVFKRVSYLMRYSTQMKKKLETVRSSRSYRTLCGSKHKVCSRRNFKWEKLFFHHALEKAR